jgi:bifunctional DNase/RNase
MRPWLLAASLCLLLAALPWAAAAALFYSVPVFPFDPEPSPTRGTLGFSEPSLPNRADDPREERDPTPEGFERASVVGVTSTERGHAIVLQAGQRALPIFVGESEGLSIQLRLSGEKFHRPLTHDLLDAALAELGGQIESVRVERYEEEIYYAVVVLRHDAERRELDSRTSDAIALALGHSVPIFVRTTVLDVSSVDLRGLLPLPADAAGRADGSAPRVDAPPAGDSRTPFDGLTPPPAELEGAPQRSPSAGDYEPREPGTVAL